MRRAGGRRGTFVEWFLEEYFSPPQPPLIIIVLVGLGLTHVTYVTLLGSQCGALRVSRRVWCVSFRLCSVSVCRARSVRVVVVVRVRREIYQQHILKGRTFN